MDLGTVSSTQITGGDDAKLSFGPVLGIFGVGQDLALPVARTGAPSSGTSGLTDRGEPYFLVLRDTGSGTSDGSPTSRLSVARWERDDATATGWLLALCVRPATVAELADGYAESLMTIRHLHPGTPIEPTTGDEREISGPTTPLFLSRLRVVAEFSAQPLERVEGVEVIELFDTNDRPAQLWVVR